MLFEVQNKGLWRTTGSFATPLNTQFCHFNPQKRGILKLEPEKSPFLAKI